MAPRTPRATVAQRGFLITQSKRIQKFGIGAIKLSEDGVSVETAVEFLTKEGISVTVQGNELLCSVPKKETVTPNAEQAKTG